MSCVPWAVGTFVENRDERDRSVQTRRYRVTAIGVEGFLALETYFRSEQRSLTDGRLHVTCEITFTQPRETYVATSLFFREAEWKVLGGETSRPPIARAPQGCAFLLGGLLSALGWAGS